MANEFLGDRKKALEDSFFAVENAKLLARLREEREKRTARAGLEEMGIHDVELLDKLVALDIGPDTWTALSLVPLVEVGWADGRMDAKERSSVLTAAEASGVLNGSPAWLLLESWLLRRPDGRLMQAWGEYTVAICAELGQSEKEALRDEILGRARRVAEATGGLLGLGDKVGTEERTVLSELEKAFGS